MANAQPLNLRTSLGHQIELLPHGITATQLDSLSLQLPTGLGDRPLGLSSQCLRALRRLKVSCPDPAVLLALVGPQITHLHLRSDLGVLMLPTCKPPFLSTFRSMTALVSLTLHNIAHTESVVRISPAQIAQETFTMPDLKTLSVVGNIEQLTWLLGHFPVSSSTTVDITCSDSKPYYRMNLLEDEQLISTGSAVANLLHSYTQPKEENDAPEGENFADADYCPPNGFVEDALYGNSTCRVYFWTAPSLGVRKRALHQPMPTTAAPFSITFEQSYVSYKNAHVVWRSLPFDKVRGFTLQFAALPWINPPFECLSPVMAELSRQMGSLDHLTIRSCVPQMLERILLLKSPQGVASLTELIPTFRGIRRLTFNSVQFATVVVESQWHTS